MELAIDVHDVAVDWHDRNVTPCPVCFLDHAFASQQSHLDLRHFDLALFQHSDAVSFKHHAIRDLIFVHGIAIAQQQQILVFVLFVPVFAQRDTGIIDPVLDVIVRASVVNQFIVRVLLLELILADLGNHECVLRITPVELLCARIEVDAERIRDLLDLDVLLEAIVIVVFGLQSPHAVATSYCPLKGSVIGFVGIADRFDVTDQTLHDIGSLFVALLDCTQFDLWSILTLIASDLTDVLTQTIKLIAWSSLALALLVLIPLLALNRHEPHIIQRAYTILAVSFDAQLKASAHLIHELVVFFNHLHNSR